MALRSGYKGFKKVAEGLKMIRPGILSVDDVALSETFLPRSEQALLGTKNLLPNMAKSGTAATNVNYIVNSDGSITANGTPVGDDAIAVNTTGYFLTTDDIGKNETILTGAPTGSSATTYCLVAIIRPKTGGSATNLYFDYGEGVKVRALTDTERLEVRINLITGKQLDNKTFYPMLRLASDPDDTYIPYAMTNRELTTSAADQKTAINAIITAATSAADFAAFKTAMGAITPVTRSLSRTASPEDVPEEVEEKPVTKKTTKKTVKEGE